MATIRKRGGKFQAIVRRGYHSQAKTFSKRADAEHWAKRLEIEIERNVAALPNSADGITFGELITSYQKRCTASQKGIGRTKSYNLERLYEYFGHLPAQLAKHHLLEFAEMRRKKHKVKPPTLLMDMNLLGAIAKHAVNYLDLGVDLRPFSAVCSSLSADGDIMRSEERKRRPSGEELQALFDYFNSNSSITIPMAKICEVSLATSMRLGEICSIKWADFNEIGKQITMRQRKSPTRPHDHCIPLISTGQYRSYEIVLEQKKHTGNQIRIFPYNARSVSTNFTRACAKLGILDLRFHDLRHEAISQMFENKLGIQHIMLMSGHSDMKQLSRYTNTTPEEVFRHLESLNGQQKKSA